MSFLGNVFRRRVINKREPDELIGGKENPYLRRWYLIKWGWINLYLHEFLRSDDDRALHDHPGDNISMLIEGQYKEWMPAHPDYGPYCYTFKIRKPGLPIFRKAEQLHRIELMKDVQFGEGRYPDISMAEKPVLTLFWRFKHRREWGFSCVSGWKHWSDFDKVGCG